MPIVRSSDFKGNSHEDNFIRFILRLVISSNNNRQTAFNFCSFFQNLFSLFCYFLFTFQGGLPCFASPRRYSLNVGNSFFACISEKGFTFLAQVVSLGSDSFEVSDSRVQLFVQGFDTFLVFWTLNR